MKTLTLKTIGASPVWPATSIEIEVKKIADAIENNITGYPATEKQAEQLTQEFIDKHEIKAKYHSGTFLGFRISDDAEDEFDTFQK